MVQSLMAGELSVMTETDLKKKSHEDKLQEDLYDWKAENSNTVLNKGNMGLTLPGNL